MLNSALVLSLLLQAAPPTVPNSSPTQEKVSKTEAPPEKGDKKHAEEKPVTTQHQLKLPGRILKYSVTTGLMPLKNEQGEKEADIFFMAYTAERPGGPGKRPLMLV